jgi:hypothetical protein
MHSMALVCERFPNGDRGGNSIPTVQGRNLHALWDNLLGRQHRTNDVKREVAELRQRPTLWKVDTKSDVEAWIQESCELAKTFAYSPQILDAVQLPGELANINLPRDYLEAAGDHARGRVVAAGLRLAVLLGGKPTAEQATEKHPEFDFDSEPPRPMTLTPPAARAMPVLGYLLNLNGNVRHNSSCRWYQNTKRGRDCGPDEGRACGICGG